MSPLLRALADRPLLLDGGMGTRLVALGLDLDRDDPSLWALDRPEAVSFIHRDDLIAGADVVLTDTFGAGRAWLARFGRADHAPAINREAARLARQEAGPRRFVLGSIGPVGADDPADTLARAKALADGGVDGLILETHAPRHALSRMSHLRGALDLPVLVSMYPDGTPPAGVEGAAAIGYNCLADLGQVASLLGRLRAATALPLLAMPSAGRPGEAILTPVDLARAVPDWLAAGARLIGGCCGTTAAHVAALRQAIDGHVRPGPPVPP